MKFFISLLCYFSFTLLGLAKDSTTPNYDFTLDRFKSFTPGNEVSKLETEFGKGETYQNLSSSLVQKFIIKHNNYIFPVFVQSVGGKITDFFAPLPSFFLHDEFHQSLIDALGKQVTSYKQEALRIFKWPDVKGISHLYEGTCTNTCFPLYYSQAMNGEKTPPLSKILTQSEY